MSGDVRPNGMPDRRTEDEKAQARAFGEWLKAELDQRGLSMYALATASGVAYTTVRDYAKGLYIPKAGNVTALAEGLGVPEGVVWQAMGLLMPGEGAGVTSDRQRLIDLVTEMPEPRVPYALVAVEAVLSVPNPSASASLRKQSRNRKADSGDAAG